MGFMPNKVAIVDVNGANAVVRGGSPLIGEDAEFAYHELSDCLYKLGLNLSASMLIDVCLLDCTGERSQFVPEVSSFGLDPERWPITYWPPYLQPRWDSRTVYGKYVKQGVEKHNGRFVWWPIQGMSDGDDPRVFLGFPGWDFGGCVDYVKSLAVTRVTLPSIVYFHCSSGADRTGALHTGYLMKHKGMKLPEACKVADNSTPVGAPNEDYCRLRSAYAKSIGKLG